MVVPPTPAHAAGESAEVATVAAAAGQLQGYRMIWRHGGDRWESKGQDDRRGGQCSNEVHGSLLSHTNVGMGPGPDSTLPLMRA